jgi:hypothetical protein
VISLDLIQALPSSLSFSPAIIPSKADSRRHPRSDGLAYRGTVPEFRNKQTPPSCPFRPFTVAQSVDLVPASMHIENMALC